MWPYIKASKQKIYHESYTSLFLTTRGVRTSHSFNENQPMHWKRNFLKIFCNQIRWKSHVFIESHSWWSTDDSPHLQTRPKYTNLPHVKVATIQTCPKYKLAPLYCVWQDTVRVGCIWSSIECVSGSAGNGLGQQTVWSIDRCYVYSVMSISNRAILISYCWTLFYNLTCYHTRSIKLIREIAYTSWSNR